MKIQAKDCAQGGIFQMEPERDDNARTRIVHRLAGTDPADPLTAFYFDNPNFRARLGQFLGSECQNVTTGPPSRFCVRVTPRVNIGNGASAAFVVRDSAQVATRIGQLECGPDFANNLGLAETGTTAVGCRSGTSPAAAAWAWSPEKMPSRSPTRPPSACRTVRHKTGCGADSKSSTSRSRYPMTSRLTPRYSTNGLTAPLTPPFTG